MKHAAIYYLILLAGFVTFCVFAAAGKVDNVQLTFASDSTSLPTPPVENDDYYSGPNLETPQRVRPPRLKSYYDFCGERLPIEDFDVRERLDRELLTNTFYHSSTQHILKYQTRFMPIIEQILREEGVPEDLKYIAVAESAFRDFKSPAGAAGVWHFMEGTAKQYGLEVNGEVDERYHLELATHAAARFFKDLKKQMGTWTLAAAAYNRGAAGVRNQVQQQRAEDFYELNLNAETARYFFRVVALKDILQDPEYYGFFLEPVDKYPPIDNYSTVTVSETILNLGDWANKYGTNYRMLKIYNPWLRDNRLTISRGNSYDIRVPRR